AAAGSRWWREHFRRAGVDPASITGVADLPYLPFTTKADLRASYPLGWASVPDQELIRIHASSGTTGKRTVCAYTRGDVEDWIEQFARCFAMAGVTPTDRVQVMVGYGLWTAGVGFQAGAERLGAMVVPTGPGNLELQLEMMLDLRSTVLCATSSFALLIAETVEERGLREELSVRIGIIGSERWGPKMRERIETLLGIETFDIYGLTELYGPGTGIECPIHDGIHVWSDYFVVEIVDPESGEPLPPGEEGEIVLTTLRKEAMPLIRYRTRDISRLYAEPCPCGSLYPRIGRLTGRTDDMVKVRGVGIFPAQVESVLARFEGVCSEYQLHVYREPCQGDLLVIRVEAEDRLGLRDELVYRLREGLSVRPEVELVPPGSLPRSERKTRRVFDHRTE
ncbi:MAG: phenylacetate--CoA ligase, partial [Chloroflexota bacterium]